MAVQRGNTSVNGGMLLMMCCSYITVLCFIPCIIDAIVVFILHRCINTCIHIECVLISGYGSRRINAMT